MAIDTIINLKSILQKLLPRPLHLRQIQKKLREVQKLKLLKIRYKVRQYQHLQEMTASAITAVKLQSTAAQGQMKLLILNPPKT